MTREEKCKLAIERGYTYDPETGLIYSRFNRIINTRYTKSRSFGYVYLSLRLNNKNYNLRAHQFAWYWVNRECVEHIDHINGIKDDNRICNLRSVTHQQNHFNRITSKGYYYNKANNKYRSQLFVNSKKIHLGYYNTEQEAQNAYLAAKEIYHKF